MKKENNKKRTDEKDTNKKTDDKRSKLTKRTRSIY